MISASPDGERGVIMDEGELHLLAKLLLVNHIKHSLDDWLLWENLPALGEVTFHVLCDAMDDIAWQLRAEIRASERAHGLDSAELLEAAQR